MAQHRSKRLAEELHGIGAVAARTGVSERTLRYYEEIGLLRPHSHEPGEARRYCEDDVERVRRIRELQSLMGFNLEEIRSVIGAERRLDSLREDYRRSSDSAHQRQVLDTSMGVLEELRGAVIAKIDALQGFLAQLDERVARHRRKLEELGGRVEPQS